MINFQMEQAVADFVKARRRLRTHYEGTGLSFTLDGKLVGDIAGVWQSREIKTPEI